MLAQALHRQSNGLEILGSSMRETAERRVAKRRREIFVVAAGRDSKALARPNSVKKGYALFERLAHGSFPEN